MTKKCNRDCSQCAFWRLDYDEYEGAYQEWGEYCSNSESANYWSGDSTNAQTCEEYEPREDVIVIKKNPNGDTRTAKKGVTVEDFQKANDMHREDVSQVMDMLADDISTAGALHDHTKKGSLERMFYRDFNSTMNDGEDFTKSEWYNIHVNTERHHLLSRCPEDVNMIDVMEMIADCVCAGLARSGEVRELEISNSILQKAVQNTVKYITDRVIVDDED